MADLARCLLICLTKALEFSGLFFLLVNVIEILGIF